MSGTMITCCTVCLDSCCWGWCHISRCSGNYCELTGATVLKTKLKLQATVMRLKHFTALNTVESRIRGETHLQTVSGSDHFEIKPGLWKKSFFEQFFFGRKMWWKCAKRQKRINTLGRATSFLCVIVIQTWGQIQKCISATKHRNLRSTLYDIFSPKKKCGQRPAPWLLINRAIVQTPPQRHPDKESLQRLTD